MKGPGHRYTSRELAAVARGVQLLAAAEAGNLADVQALLAQSVHLGVSRSTDGNTALIHAAYNGHTEIARLLISCGADLNAANRYGETALSVSEKAGRTEIAQILREAAEQREMEAQKKTKAEYYIARHLECLRTNLADLELVINSGDLRKVRAFFDLAFWNNRKLEPGWRDVKLALLAENKPVLRFLITWGATCTSQSLDELRKITLDKYPHYISLLRQCGLNLRAAETTLAQDFNSGAAAAELKSAPPRPIPPPARIFPL